MLYRFYMWRICTILISCFLSAAGVQAEENTEYFPDQENCELDDYMHCGTLAWMLEAADEPSFLEQSLLHSGFKGYRFFWIRSFHVAVVIRVVFNADGSATLVAKTLDRSKRYAAQTSETIQLSNNDLTDLNRHANAVRKWILASAKRDSSAGTDGAEWCFEIVSETEFNASCRWSPEPMPPIPITNRNRHVIPEWRKTDADFHALGTEMIKLSGMDFGPIY